MLDVITNKQELIERELQIDASRSDRAIARIVGCDHKTVGNARAKLLPIPQSGEFDGDDEQPTLDQFRNLLVNGAKEFDEKYPPESAEQIVDRMIVEKLVEAPRAVPDGGGDDFGSWRTNPNVVVKSQQAIAIYFNNDGDLVIRQERDWCNDEDLVVWISESFQQAFLDKLCDVMGVPTLGA